MILSVATPSARVTRFSVRPFAPNLIQATRDVPAKPKGQVGSQVRRRIRFGRGTKIQIRRSRLRETSSIGRARRGGGDELVDGATSTMLS